MKKEKLKEIRKMISQSKIDGRFAVWKYMSLWKFVSMVSTSSLYLARLDQFEDDHEVEIPFSDLVALNFPIYSNSKRNYIIQKNRLAVKRFFVSSWIKRIHESMALWKIYCNDMEGVAIKCYSNELVAAFEKGVSPDSKFQHGLVDYGTPLRHVYPKDGIFINPMVKNTSYDYENEYRYFFKFSKVDNKKLGHRLKMENLNFIKEIRLPPKCSDAFAEVVLDLCKKYGLNIKVERSDLEFKLKGKVAREFRKKTKHRLDIDLHSVSKKKPNDNG